MSVIFFFLCLFYIYTNLYFIEKPATAGTDLKDMGTGMTPPGTKRAIGIAVMNFKTRSVHSHRAGGVNK